MKDLEKNLKVRFSNKELLKNALTHRSWLNENRNENLPSNERLEFLGDAVLEFWVTKELFTRFPQLPEGVLTNIRASLVCTENLFQKAKSIGLGKYVLLSRGEEKTGGRNNPSILADTFEAIVGAIFIDAGLEPVEKFLASVLLDELKARGGKGDIKDGKTRFQELAQATQKITPTYKILGERGPDHHKLFRVGAYLGKRKIAEGEGWSKQEAEEAAATKALTEIENEVK